MGRTGTPGSAPAAEPGADGRDRHAAAVARLQASYAAIPRGQTVRLAKKTSNLFRPRAAQEHGLDVSGLDGVIAIDRERRTADVQGMCTYEHLVDATLPHGLMPRVVPQLRTITLGGAVTGLGIESSSFRNGLPHESVLEMDVLVGDGRIVTATPDNEHSDLFFAFPNSYGSLGYAVRLRIELEQVATYVGLRHVRFDDLDSLAKTAATITETRDYDGERVDFLDGVVFEPDEAYLTLGRWTDDVADSGVLRPSDYTGQDIYYRSLRERSRDALTAYDYLWRWDTDWFWCSRAFGAQHPVARRAWPRRWRRSDVYYKIVGLENRFRVKERIDRRRGKPDHERVVQDIEVPVDRTADFLRWFTEHVPMRPVWLCPLRLRDVGGPGSARTWPLYPLKKDTTYVNVGFWGTVPIEAGRVDGDVNRAIEQAVADHDGHKSLYSDAYYDEETFARIYGGATYEETKRNYDPDHRLSGLYEKAVGRR
jgi:FAD/FMN-containing dehydrogenase